MDSTICLVHDGVVGGNTGSVGAMSDEERFGESRDSFSAGKVYWLRALATVAVSVALAFVAEIVRAVA